ncbi:hypothetical protein MASR1M49_43860 [Pararhodobacter aggregans]
MRFWMEAILAPARTIKSVADFVKHVLAWRADELSPAAFRGQKYTEWKTIPKLFREEVGIYEHEKSAVRDLISVHPQEFHSDDTMFDRLVRMQHYGLPTRLLDVTTNPLVALYFACEDHVVRDEPQDGKVQAFFPPDAQMRYYDSDWVGCLGRVDKRDSQGGLIVIQAGICDGDQLGTRPDVGRGMGLPRALHSGRPGP